MDPTESDLLNRPTFFFIIFCKEQLFFQTTLRTAEQGAVMSLPKGKLLREKWFHRSITFSIDLLIKGNSLQDFVNSRVDQVIQSSIHQKILCRVSFGVIEHVSKLYGIWKSKSRSFQEDQYYCIFCFPTSSSFCLSSLVTRKWPC